MELIGKQIAIETILGQPPELHYPSWYAAQIEKLPPAPPEYLAEQAGILVTDADTISRQAAIDTLRGYLVGKRCPDDGTLTCRLIENEVINKLPPANCSEFPNSSDTISRAKAIEAVNCVMIMKGIRSGKSIVAEAVESAKRIMTDNIRDLPSAQSETAKRIVGKSRGGMTLWYQCDMCNEPVDVQDNFCRGCGRRLIDE